MSKNNTFLKYEEIIKPKLSMIDSLSLNQSKSRFPYELEDLFPPIDKIIHGRCIKLQVSTHQATESELISLKTVLDQRLAELKTLVPGLNIGAWTTHADLFDELIRQEVLNCTERGHLWLLIKKEIELTLRSLNKSNKSCFAYGVNKMFAMNKELSRLKTEIPELQNLASRTKDDTDIMIKDWNTRKAERVREEQIKKIERGFQQNQILKDNEGIREQLVQRYDPEHKWLKDRESI